MKLQPTPLILLLIALALGGFVYFHEIQAAPQREATQAKAEQLFSFQEQDVQSLTLKTPKQTLSFVKTPVGRLQQSVKQQLKPEEQPKSDTLIWLMTAPKESPASDASVSYLLNQLATGKRQQTLTVPRAKLAEFGLDQPQADIQAKLNNQQSHRLLLGQPNFNRTALYAQVDPPLQPIADVSVVLVSMDFENAVTRPLAEWVAPSAPAKPSQPATK